MFKRFGRDRISLNCYNDNRCTSFRKGILCMAILLSYALEMSAAGSNHYIIAFDLRPQGYESFFHSNSTLNKVEGAMKNLGFDSNRDYVSILGYSMDTTTPTEQDFVRPYKMSDNEPIIWYKLENQHLISLFPDWTTGPKGEPALTVGSSMQSIVKPYAVMETAHKADSLVSAIKTYLILVTDDEANGDKGVQDYYRQEWKNVFQNTHDGLKETMFDKIGDFNKEFTFSAKKSTLIQPGPNGASYSIYPYEVESSEKPSIYSVTDMPTPLPFERVRGGLKLNFDARAISDKYKIKSVRVSDISGQVLGESKSGRLDVMISSNKVSSGDSVLLSMDLQLKDGFYNGMIISPENPRYAEGMSVLNQIRIRDEAKIFGIIPLVDALWWWFPNDQYTAVMVWDVIILLILIVIIGFILYKWFIRINTYKPTDDKLKITKI